MNRLRDKYKNEVRDTLMKEFSYSSIMQVPRLEKIVLNVGIGNVRENPKAVESAVRDLTTIAGQKPVVVNAKKSVANFKLREGMPNGVKVTIRGDRMYQFLDKLISIALPRVRDFRGVNPNSFDGHGNFSLGAREQLIFPEVDYDSIDKINGLDIAIVTTAKTDEEAKALLTELGMPFSR
ncbi:MAG: 50S ribosomal protein L5 [Clostridiales bacterium]|jgi:large subunit ribosomal protein L5|nr:50S ribosomal protein L5 [Clostridiales bacterium]MDD2571726.1 50S ribosomal protein L5 [Eubacteriales bacterium]MDY0119229.1 50S ribosomal protein L5 [Clostridia bacterium]NLG30855.1 50S ribosomal protein L5 [Clostridiaceae bacterium]MCK9349991.1 50S ribosomal protein L5 [Clostridiales bacterium]